MSTWLSVGKLLQAFQLIITVTAIRLAAIRAPMIKRSQDRLLPLGSFLTTSIGGSFAKVFSLPPPSSVTGIANVHLGGPYGVDRFEWLFRCVPLQPLMFAFIELVHLEES